MGGPRYFNWAKSDANATRDFLQHWRDVAGAKLVWPGTNALCTSPEQSAMLATTVKSLNMTLGQLNGFHPAQDDTMVNLTDPHSNCSTGIAAAETILGPWRYLGPSSCESGGRYMNSYAGKGAAMMSATTWTTGADGRSAQDEQRDVFDDWMEREYEHIGHRVVALTTTTAEAAPWLESGFYSMVGTETAQTNGNVHVHWAVNRGAAKQHGVALHADVSVYTGNGHKVPGDPNPTPSCTRNSDHGPTCGTSFALMKRLLYTEMLYGASVVTVEGGAFYGRPDISGNYTLTPIGRIQRALSQFASSLEAGTYASSDLKTQPPHATSPLQAPRHAWQKRSTPRPSGPYGGFVHLSTVAVLHDAHAGWIMPCTGSPNNPERFRAGFHNLPWGAPEFFLDGVLNATFPGYARGAWYSDESGYLGPAPYSDGVDKLGDDAPDWVLLRYDTILVTARLWRAPQTTRRRLRAVVRNGGHVIITASSLAVMGELLGLSAIVGTATGEEACQTFAAGTAVHLDDLDLGQGAASTVVEPTAFTLCPHVVLGSAATDAHVIATVNGSAAAVSITVEGGGSLTVLLAGAYATATETPEGAVAAACGVDKETQRTRPLLRHARVLVERALARRALFEIGTSISGDGGDDGGTEGGGGGGGARSGIDGLAWSVLRKDPDQTAASSASVSEVEYMLVISNPWITQQPFSIALGAGMHGNRDSSSGGSSVGRASIVRLQELELDQSEKGAEGYWPHGFNGSAAGVSGPSTIAGGDLRIFIVTVAGEATAVALLPQGNVPPMQPRTWLRLSDGADGRLSTQMRRRPSIAQRVGGFVVGWRYVYERDLAGLAAAGAYLRARNLTVAVDATSAITPFPGWRLCNDSAVEYARSMAGLSALVAKLPALGASTLIVSTHDAPESTSLSQEQLESEISRSLRTLADKAQAVGVTLALRQARKNLRGWTYAASAHFTDVTVNHSNVVLAPSVALLLRQNVTAATRKAVADLVSGVRPVLLVAAPTTDEFGALVSDNAPLAGIESNESREAVRAILAAARSGGATVVYDAAYTSIDSELADFDALEELQSMG
jgi:hypothetical protein